MSIFRCEEEPSPRNKKLCLFWRTGSCYERTGAQVEQVDEHRTSPCATFIFEFNCYPEGKILSKSEVKAVYKRFKKWDLVANEVGTSEAFVRQR